MGGGLILDLSERIGATARGHSVEAILSIALSLVLTLSAWALGRWMLLHLPSDFLVARPAQISSGRRALRNLSGLALTAVGVALLALPGPGVLFIVLGVALCELPGRTYLLRRLLRREVVLGPLNRLRVRHGRPALRTPSAPEN